MKKKKKDTIKSLATHEKDVGSTEVQIGLLTDKVRPKFEALGLLEYEHAPDDFECDWNELEKPLEKFGEIPKVI